MWLERPTLGKWGNQIFDSQAKLFAPEAKKSGSTDYTSLNVLTPDIPNSISSSKWKHHEYLANKLNDPKTAPKTYYTILKTFVNGSKIPLITPLLVDNKLGTDFCG